MPREHRTAIATGAQSNRTTLAAAAQQQHLQNIRHGLASKLLQVAGMQSARCEIGGDGGGGGVAGARGLRDAWGGGLEVTRHTSHVTRNTSHATASNLLHHSLITVINARDIPPVLCRTRDGHHACAVLQRKEGRECNGRAEGKVA